MQPVSNITITSDMLMPITNAISNNLATLLPVGIGIVAIMLGISLIPRIIWKFF